MQQIEAYPHDPKADSFDFRTTWLAIRNACRAHKILILFTCLLTVGFVAAYCVIWPPIYTSTITLAAESERDATRDEFYQTWNIFRKERLNDEVQMITTTPVLAEVIDRLHLTDNDVYHSFFGYAAKLWTESWPGQAWKATKKFLFGSRRHAYEPTEAEIDRAQTIDSFRDGVKFAALSDANVGKLMVKGPTPRVAEMADTLGKVYMRQRLERQQQEADNAYQSLATEAAKAEVELVALEQRMTQYYTANGLVLSFEKDKLDVGEWGALRAAVTADQSAIANNMASLAQVNAQLGGEFKEIVTAKVVKPSSAHDALTDKIAQLDLARKQMLLHYLPTSPEVKELDRQLVVVREQLALEPTEIVQQSQVSVNEAYQALALRQRQLQSDLAGQRAALAIKQDQVSKIRGAIDQIPEKMKVTHAFDRQHEALEKRYSVLQDKMMVAAVSRAAAASAPASIRIVENASHPDKPGWPKTKLMLPGAAVVGAVAGVLLALLMELFRGRVTRTQLASIQDRMPVYALISHDSVSANRLFNQPPATAQLSAPAAYHGQI